MMGRVMEHVVKEIPGEQAGKDGRGEAAEKQKKKPVEHKRERNAHGGRHHEAGGIVRINVMHALKHEKEGMTPLSFLFVMKKTTMDGGFYEKPNQKTRRGQAP